MNSMKENLMDSVVKPRNDKKLWRSVADYENSPEFLERLAKEFPSGAKELEVKPGMERRKFLELIGSSMALAGVMSTGCIRRPKEFIYPENNRPENALPGVPKFYSTTALVGPSVLGLSVTSTDGRPTKIDGNSRHPMNNPIPNSNMGSSNAFVQAEILNLYDSDRGQTCFSNKKSSTKENILKILNLALKKSATGNGIALLVESFASPSFYSLLSVIKNAYPNISIAEQNTSYTQNRIKGVSQLVGKNADVSYDISKADVILALDADFLGVEGDTVKNAREFADRRKRVDQDKTMSRLYSVESNLSITGSNADHRYALNSFKIADVLVGLANEIKKMSASIPVNLGVDLGTSQPALEGRLAKWVSAVAKDMLQNNTQSLVIVGAKQPAWMHALGLIINQALGAFNKSVHVFQRSAPQWLQDPESVVQAYQDKSIDTLVMVGGNPLYSMPANLNFQNVIQNAKESFYLGFFHDETAQMATHYIPQTHFLESWGDTLANDGTYAIRQPLIAPLFDTCANEYEFVSALTQEGVTGTKTDYQTVQTFCKEFAAPRVEGSSGKVTSPRSKSQTSLTFEDAWRSYLSNGVVNNSDFTFSNEKDWDVKFLQDAYLKHTQAFNKPTETTMDPAVKPQGDTNIEVVFALSNTLYDGRYANNPWMQELPDPMSKLVWDNALLLNPKTARKLNLSGNPKPGSSTVDMVTLKYNQRLIEVPVWEVPGIAEGTGVLNLGYGSQAGKISKKYGFNANKIRTSDSWFSLDANIQKSGKTYSLVTTQEHGTMVGDPSQPDHRPPAVRSASLAQYISDPNFVLKDEIIPLDEQKSMLFDFPKDADQSKWARQQWGMSIDLNSCIGCNACTVACQAENNISVVGKEQVFKSRVMNWIRIDRYFAGDVNDPELEVLFQPLNCQHCENAPCEAVCPVAATTHSPDGLNEMTYNRCVGTRYCANNCPYKVRRYNFFNYSEENDKNNSLYAMQKNPNVTVRFRGVMEKCTYCVQKINTAKNKSGGNPVPDGSIVTACQSVCPTNAIVFGDVADPLTSVSKLKALPRNYGLLGELNTRPRTTYLAKIRNINPEIG
jgi:MoCo/4Fe-4S cofactor protein with predicted Tat translocation signal